MCRRTYKYEIRIKGIKSMNIGKSINSTLLTINLNEWNDEIEKHPDVHHLDVGGVGQSIRYAGKPAQDMVN